jgi:hypothetical protein
MSLMPSPNHEILQEMPRRGGQHGALCQLPSPLISAWTIPGTNHDNQFKQIWTHRSPSTAPSLLFMAPAQFIGCLLHSLKAVKSSAQTDFIAILSRSYQTHRAQSHSHLTPAFCFWTGNSSNDGLAQAEYEMLSGKHGIGGVIAQAHGGRGWAVKRESLNILRIFLRTMLGSKVWKFAGSIRKWKDNPGK